MGKDHDFLDAARSGNVLFIEKVLNQKAKRSGPLASLRRGPVVNVQDSSGYSALHHACLNGHIDIVRLLLAYEASPNLPDVRGSSPLHLAAWAGHTNIVKMLLMHPYKPANTNFQTIENETPLHCAAQHGHTGALSALLAHDADPNIRNIRNETPLDLAAQYGRLKAVEILIRSHPELIAPNISENSQSLPAHTCLHLASRNGHKNVVEVLLAAGVDVNLRAISGSALHEAALCGKESVVRTLLKAGIDLNATDAEGRTALDILKEFPPHVTRDIILVIDYFKSQMEATKSDQISQQAQMCSENNYQGRSQLRPQNHHYHFNSNNHLLNHTLSVQQPIQQYSNKGQNRNDVNSCAAPRDNRIKQSPNALEEIKCNLGEGNLLFARTTNDSQKDMAISPSSSMKSFEPTSVSPRSRSSTGGNTTNVTVSAPPKPPRRNLSVSPIQNVKNKQSNFISPKTQHLKARYHQQLSSQKHQRCHSSDSYSPPQNIERVCFDCCDEVQIQDRQRNQPLCIRGPGVDHEYIYQASSRSAEGNGLITSASHDMLNDRLHCTVKVFEMSEPTSDEMTHSCRSTTSNNTRLTSAPRSPVKIGSDLVNPILKFYNPNRKLKRNRNNCSLGDKHSPLFTSNNSTDIDNSDTAQPQSPTNYLQPPTPEHSPPSVNQAEHMIHERMRPLSQEYKRRSALGMLYQHHQNDMIETATSPPTFQLRTSNSSTSNSIARTSHIVKCVHLDQSCSLSSTSCSDCSIVSTDCVEEYISDVPFAGLFKGSAIQRTHEREKRHDSDSQVSNLIGTDSADNKTEQVATSDLEEEFSSEFISRQQRIRNFFERRNDDALQEEGALKKSDSAEVGILTPFHEEEAWERISEIIASFGSGILSNDADIDAFDPTTLLLDFDYDYEDNEMRKERRELATRLRQMGLLQLERILFENGYDNYKFMNGVLDECDMNAMNISTAYRSKLLKCVTTFPTAKFQPYRLPPTHALDELNKPLSPDKESGVSTLSDWLSSIELSEYTECFEKHLYNSIESVCGVWDVELQTVLQINKIGHRRRILRSLAYMKEVQQPQATRLIRENNDQNLLQKAGNSPEVHQQATKTQQHRKQAYSGKRPARKNRPAPSPPVARQSSPKATLNHEICAPSEVLLGLPSNLRAKWLHSALVLVKEQLKYEVYYLGSTLIKELRGTESTRKSIQKLKRDKLTTTATTSITSSYSAATMVTCKTRDQKLPLPKTHSNNNEIVPAIDIAAAQQTQQMPLLVCLAISQSGVEFIDIANNLSICEHKIQNINCACQDATDLSYFAYITKEQDMYYCHVFHVNSTDLATEIILTLGQAFEVAYQLALRNDISSLEPQLSPAAVHQLN